MLIGNSPWVVVWCHLSLLFCLVSERVQFGIISLVLPLVFLTAYSLTCVGPLDCWTDV